MVLGRVLATLAMLTSGAAYTNELTWEGGITAVLQDADDNRVDSELTASVDLFLTLPRSNGEWLLSVAGWQVDNNALNIRVGMANKDVSVATRFASVAYERSTPIGLFGLGLARTRISNSFRQADLDDVTSAEVFLRIPIGAGDAQITPSIQHVENPGFDISGPTFSSSALVAGVRFHWSFEK